MGLHSIEICAGVGMLGEGLRAGLKHLGITHRTVCYVEREAYAAAILAARIEEGSLDPAPIWTDLLTFDGAAWHGAVDCIVAGFPCQDLSLAGKRAGLDGARSGLFFDILDIADACGARGLFLENVAGIASATASVVDEAEGELEERAAARVLGELADRGWNAEWLTLSASDVGASHGRARWFCWAWRSVENAESNRGTERPNGRLCDGSGIQSTRGADHGSDAGQDVADSTGRDGGELSRSDQRGLPQPHGGTSGHADVGHTGLQHQHLQQWLEGAEHQATSDGVADPECNGIRGDECRSIKCTPSEICGEVRKQRVRLDFGSERSPVADAGRQGLQGHELRSAHEPDGRTDGRTDGRSRNHADQLPNFIMMNFSHPDQQTPDGQESSGTSPTSPRRLNPIFGEWLMGWPLQWTKAEPSASSASATALWRCALQQQLSCLFDGQAL